MAVEADSARIRFPPPFVYLGTLLLGFALERLTGLRSFETDRAMLVGLGAALILAGGFFGIPAMGLFRRAGTNVEPWRPATAIVTDGVYRWTRNPMYLGMALIYAGLAVAFNGPLALLLLPAVLVVIQTRVIAFEERYLETKFGDEYLRYKARVRRWI